MSAAGVRATTSQKSVAVGAENTSEEGDSNYFHR